MLQSVFTKLPDVLPANFFNIEWGERGIVILVMISDKNMQFFDCSKVFWPELSDVLHANFFNIEWGRGG